MKVSVIIPNYNHSRYLRKRIDSVVNQTFQEVEVIILDDCSSDKSKSVIEAYRAHPKVVHIVYNKMNSGSLFRQWKTGIDLAQGDYIWIAESDDWAEPDFLEKLLPVFKQNDKIGLVYCDCRIVDENDQFTGKLFSEVRNRIYPGWTKSYVRDGKEELDVSLSRWCSINNASAVLFRAEALKNSGLELQLFSYGGDWAAYIAVAKDYKIGYLHQPLSNYREHPVNASKKAYSSGKIFVDHYRIFKMCLNSIYRRNHSQTKYISEKMEQVIYEPYYNLTKKKYILLLGHYLMVEPFLLLKFIGKAVKSKVKF